MTYIYLAGIEEKKRFLEAIRRTKSPRVLVSYFLLRKQHRTFFQDLTADDTFQVMVDSGAYTLQEKQHPTLTECEKFLAEYAEFLAENKSRITSAVELDLDPVYGYDVIRRWEEEYFFPLEEQGLPIIYVWHDCRGEGSWERMCRKHSYVGISSGESRLGNYLECGEDLARFLATARRYCCKTHGFGMTRSGMMKDASFYSCDSSTWVGSERFGMNLFFTGSAISQLREPNEAYIREVSSICRDLGFDYADFDKDKLIGNCTSAVAYHKLEKLLLALHGTDKENCIWNFRLPRSAIVFQAPDSDIIRWQNLLGLEDASPDRNFVTLSAAIANHESDVLDALDRDSQTDIFEYYNADSLAAAQDNLYDLVRPVFQEILPRDAKTRFEEVFTLQQR